MKTCNHLRKRFLLFLCFCTFLVLTACQKTIPQPDITEEPLEISYDTTREWMPVYNAHECELFVSMVLPIAFEETLTQEDIEKILPTKPLPCDVYSGKAMYKEDGTVYGVILYIGSPEKYITMAMGEGAAQSACCALMTPGKDKSFCGDVEYTLYEHGDELMAEAAFNGTLSFARVFKAMEKQEFEAILECFSWYPDGKPDLTQIVPREH